MHFIMLLGLVTIYFTTSQTQMLRRLAVRAYAPQFKRTKF